MVENKPMKISNIKTQDLKNTKIFGQISCQPIRKLNSLNSNLKLNNLEKDVLVLNK